MSSKPPLELAVEITDASNTRYRWDPGDRDATSVPQNLSFRTKQMDGFADGSIQLSRRIDRDFPDLGLFDSVALVGRDGSVAYEGRVGALPRSMDAGHSVTVQTTGWMAHARDRTFTEIYVDRDLGAWTTPSRARRAWLITANYTHYDSSVDVDTSGSQSLRMGFPGAWVAPARPSAEAWYDAGTANRIGKLYYEWAREANIDPANTNWAWQAYLSTTDNHVTYAWTGNLQAAGPGSGTLMADRTDYRYGSAALVHAPTPGGLAGQEYSLRWYKLAVYGTHGLPTIGTTEPKGLAASDVIKNIASRFCPKLRTDGVETTTYPIPHLVFKEDTEPYDAFLQINAHHLWQLAVWENRTLHYGGVDLSDHDWEIRLSDPGVSVDLQGDSTEALANGIVVHFDNVTTGQKERLSPQTYAELRDDSVENPANRHGIERWIQLNLSSPTTAEAALWQGRAALAENNQPKAPGSISITGHVRDRAGHWHPGWKVRAGDTIAITDHPNDRPRMVVETSWEHDSRKLTIAVDQSFKRLDALLDRLATGLRAGGLG